eukprot:Plantae.Rhodophyta-Hildenbrandia_rubra.ctg13334.p1 GENE.Plantae.Rhodophyta-Hildenbrandia_rubra.ctg13334~~Plantae.Rhodophyta-Hildenbrandia_rubra.ctg13334.p1  ORF type:complete len:268 (+),score=34.54 Plantae.Rhodophyta-Hildenbrandia_rubra.ctg13334:365-1168(+)
MNMIRGLLKKFNVEDCHPSKASMRAGMSLPKDQSPKSQEELDRMTPAPCQSLIGGLLCLASCARPGISYAAGALPRHAPSPGMAHWAAAKGALRHLKGALSRGITYDGEESSIEACCDSGSASDIDSRRSTEGFLIKIASGAASWSSRLQQTVALSAAEAERMAAAEVGKEVIWLKKLLKDLKASMESGCIVINWDNQGSLKLIKSPVDHRRAKHIDVRFHFIRNEEMKGSMEFICCSAEDMIADSLTKAAPCQKQEKCSEGMGLRD